MIDVPVPKKFEYTYGEFMKLVVEICSIAVVILLQFFYLIELCSSF